MASPTSENESAGDRNLLSLFTPITSGNFIATLSKVSARFSSRKRRECLPLPLPFSLLDPSFVTSKPYRVHGVLEDIFEHVLTNLHSIQKNLQFWQSRAERSDTSKAYFMILERGPRAFIDETIHLLRGREAHGSSIQQLSQSASVYINERVTVLSNFRYSLATFLAQVSSLFHPAFC